MVGMDRNTRQLITDHLKTRYVVGVPEGIEVIVSLDRLMFCRTEGVTERLVEIWMHAELASVRNVVTGEQKSISYDDPNMFAMVDKWMVEFLEETTFEAVLPWWPAD